MSYFQRKLEKPLLEALKTFPVVAVTGPRQSGKSTIIKHLLQHEYDIVRMDRPEVRDVFYHDPVSFMQNHSHKVVFDEAQLVPELFEYVKVAVDEDRQNYGKFVLSGSHQFNLMRGISESLAGRVANLTLLPLQCEEMPAALRDAAIWQGGYPELVQQNYLNKSLWFSSYLSTYLEKDVRLHNNIGDLRDFQRLINLLAANVSQQLNLSTLARDIGVAVSTVSRWVSILEASYIIFLVQPFYKNYGKRIVKAPKVYFYDTGLVSHLVGIDSEAHFRKGPLSGALFENYVVSEVLKKETHSVSHSDIYYFRSHSGQEVDLIIDRKRHQELIEIKLNSTFKPNMLKHVESFMSENDRGYLVYTGETKAYKDTVNVVNFQEWLLG